MYYRDSPSQMILAISFFRFENMVFTICSFLSRISFLFLLLSSLVVKYVRLSVTRVELPRVLSQPIRSIYFHKTVLSYANARSDFHWPFRHLVSHLPVLGSWVCRFVIVSPKHIYDFTYSFTSLLGTLPLSFHYIVGSNLML